MRFLLTSSGIQNDSIQNALVELLGKAIAEANALCIPTALHPFRSGPTIVYRLLSGAAANPLAGLG